jgi:transposase-like protein
MGKWMPKVSTLKGGWILTIKPRKNVEQVTFCYIVLCKFCDSDNLAKFGKSSGGGQRYVCRNCKRTFVDNNAAPGMRFPTKIVASALNLFYEGASLESIRRHIKMEHGDFPGHATVYEWVVKYTKKAVKDIGEVQVQTGDIWAADETVLKVAGSKTKEGAASTGLSLNPVT